MKNLGWAKSSRINKIHKTTKALKGIITVSFIIGLVLISGI